MRHFLAFAFAAAILAGCATSTGLPPLPEATASAGPTPIAPGRPGGALPPPSSAPVSASNPSNAIVAVNQSTAATLPLHAPPATRAENSCAPEPYRFTSRAGYEAVRVKDCRTDQLLYLPATAQAQIDGHVAECQRRCTGR
ncbi:MAG: hypothetical protein FJX02_16790 [Alphaproteobacteria bacterium]|nr:hypothetical protein [Alphaproteobacteria bacterium]